MLNSVEHKCKRRETKQEKNLLRSLGATTKAAQYVKISSSTIFKYNVSWFSATPQKATLDVYHCLRNIFTLCVGCNLQRAQNMTSASGLHTCCSLCSSRMSYVT